MLYLILHAAGIIGAGGENTQANALLYLLIGTVGIMGVFKMCYPMNRLRAFLAVTTAVGHYAVVALCLFLKDHILCLDILHMAVPTGTTLLLFVLFTAVSVLTEQLLSCTVFRKKTA